MKHGLVLIASAMLACGCPLRAQNRTPAVGIETRAENPLSGEIKQSYQTVKNNIMKSAEEMPEENYSFKPTPDIRSFGQVLGHVAESQMRTCSAIMGEQKSMAAASKASKAELVTALHDAFAQCDKVYETATDADAANMIKTPHGQRTKLGALVANTTHDTEQYGILAVYLRLKGLVPPSSKR
ncbi:MAG: DinB family protein [Bryobacteraceae bacterium]